MTWGGESAGLTGAGKAALLTGTTRLATLLGCFGHTAWLVTGRRATGPDRQAARRCRVDGIVRIATGTDWTGRLTGNGPTTGLGAAGRRTGQVRGLGSTSRRTRQVSGLGSAGRRTLQVGGLGSAGRRTGQVRGLGGTGQAAGLLPENGTPSGLPARRRTTGGRLPSILLTGTLQAGNLRPGNLLAGSVLAGHLLARHRLAQSLRTGTLRISLAGCRVKPARGYPPAGGGTSARSGTPTWSGTATRCRPATGRGETTGLTRCRLTSSRLARTGLVRVEAGLPRTRLIRVEGGLTRTGLVRVEAGLPRTGLTGTRAALWLTGPDDPAGAAYLSAGRGLTGPGDLTGRTDHTGGAARHRSGTAWHGGRPDAFPAGHHRRDDRGGRAYRLGCGTGRRGHAPAGTTPAGGIGRGAPAAGALGVAAADRAGAGFVIGFGYAVLAAASTRQRTGVLAEGVTGLLSRLGTTVPATGLGGTAGTGFGVAGAEQRPLGTGNRRHRAGGARTRDTPATG